MGAASPLPFQTSPRAGTIRRVVRRGSEYICGMCRRLYGDRAAAQDCVSQCWVDMLAADPVIVKMRPFGRTFRCRFCARDHAQRGQAARCAADCRERHKQLHEMESELGDDVGPARKKFVPRAARGAARAAAPVPVPAKPQAVDKPAVTVQPISVDAVQKAAAAAAPAAAAASATAPADDGNDDAAKKAARLAARAKRRAEGKMFYRDGARYVCHECNAKYFTKGEVETCFNSHD